MPIKGSSMFKNWGLWYSLVSCLPQLMFARWKKCQIKCRRWLLPRGKVFKKFSFHMIIVQIYTKFNILNISLRSWSYALEMQDVIWAGSFYYVLLILWIFLILMGDSGDAAKEQWVDVLSWDFVVFLIIDSKKSLEGDLFICFLFYFFGFWDGLE